MSTNTLKNAAIVCFVVAMGGLLLLGMVANREAPPYPGRVAASDGTILFTKADIIAGQDVYQRYGLMDHGSVWGHGSQRGTEFSALSLHNIGKRVQGFLAQAAYGRDYGDLTAEQRDLIDIRTRRMMKANRYNSNTDTLTLEAAQVAALNENEAYWEQTFRDGDARYGFLPLTIPTREERKQIGRFFFWDGRKAMLFAPGQQIDQLD